MDVHSSAFWNTWRNQRDPRLVGEESAKVEIEQEESSDETPI